MLTAATATNTDNWPRPGLYVCLRPGCACDFEGPSNMAHTQACPSCGWGPLLEFTPTVYELHRLQVGSEPLSLAEYADHVVADTIGRPLTAAPRALRLGIGTLSIRGEGVLEADDEETVLALLGLPSEVELGLVSATGPTRPYRVAPTGETYIMPASAPTPTTRRGCWQARERQRQAAHQCDAGCPECARWLSEVNV